LTCESPVRACSTRTAFDPSGASVPHVSYATRTSGRRAPDSRSNVPTSANCRLPTGSPSRHAPVAGTGGLTRARELDPERAPAAPGRGPRRAPGERRSSFTGLTVGHCTAGAPRAPRLSRSVIAAPVVGSSSRVRRWRSGVQRGLGGGEAELEVGEDVVDVLDADGEAHESRRDARLRLLLDGELAVRGGRRVDDERAHVADVRDVGVQLQGGDERLPGLAAAVELERQDRTRAARQVLLRTRVPRARGQARVVHGADVVARL